MTEYEKTPSGPHPPAGSPKAARIAQILHMQAFDGGMGVVIMLNMVMIIIETDYAAETEASLAWADAVGWFILTAFVIELVVRLFAFRLSFFRDGWNTFDFVIVFSDATVSLFGLFFGSVFPVSTLRVFRLFKLARVSKVFRVFPELRIMMAGLVGSFRSIFWGAVLLAFALVVWAIVAVQFIHPLNRELAERGVLDGCERCPRAYESVMQATLTFSQQIVAGDSWGQATIPVIEAYPLTAIYFMAVFLSVGFAVMNLILGVVVNVAQSEHDRLKTEIEDEVNLQKMEGRDILLRICEEMDADKSGCLTKDELLTGYREREDFREAIAYLDLKEDDLGIAFTSMDSDKSGTVSYIELVSRIYKMKDTDTEFMLEQIKSKLQEVKDLIFTKIVQNQETMLGKIEAEEELIRTKIDLESKKQNVLVGMIENEEQTVGRLTACLETGETKQSPSPPMATEKLGLPARDRGGNADEAERLSGRACSAEWEMKLEKAIQKIQIAAGESLANKELLSALSGANQLFQGEVRHTLQRLESSFGALASDPSRPLSDSVRRRPVDQFAAAPPPRGFLPVCCRGPSVRTEMLPDVSPIGSQRLRNADGAVIH